MSEESDNLLSLLTPYGLTSEEAKIYLYLLSNQASSVLEISRNLHLSRTKVYRLLDKLLEKNLVAQQLSGRGLKFIASHPQKFSQILEEQKHQTEALSASLPTLVSHLTQIYRPQKGSKVIYYEGLEGLKQVSWNITHADKLLRVFEMEHLSDFLPNDFSEEVRKKLVENKIFTRDLTNKKSFPAYTNVTEMVEHYSEYRYINPQKLKIEFETLIYNNVYCTYTYKEGKIFIVEIYNDHLANMQKSIYDFIWNSATAMKTIDSHGSTTI